MSHTDMNSYHFIVYFLSQRITLVLIPEASPEDNAGSGDV